MSYLLRILTILLALLFGIPGGHAQELKKRTRLGNEPDTYIKYHVLKSHKEIMHGPFSKETKGGALLEKGEYTYNLKSGEWTMYYPIAERIKAKGTYSNGKKNGTWKLYYNFEQPKLFAKGAYLNDERAGIWEFFTINDDLLQRYNYDDSTLLAFPAADSLRLKASVFLHGKWQLLQLDKPVSFIGGYGPLVTQLRRDVHYPKLAREKGVQGLVVVGFDVSELGEPTNYKILKGIGSGCDEEALRAVKQLPKHFIPAVYKGKKVPCKASLPIRFNLLY